MTNPKPMTIRQIGAGFGVTPRRLRFSAVRALPFPLRRGQTRLRARRDRGRRKLILRGKGFGFALDELRRFLDLSDRGDARAGQLTRTHATTPEHLAQIERRRTELDEAVADLGAALAWGAARPAAIRRPGAL